MPKKISMTELSPLIKEAINNGNEVVITVTGSSMEPLLRHGRDRVCLTGTKGRVLKKYDIPLYLRSDGKYILHRITALRKNGYVTVGDNQWQTEYPVHPSQVIGVVKGIWRDGNYISCTNYFYRLYSGFWVLLFPVRRFYTGLRRFLARMRKGPGKGGRY